LNAPDSALLREVKQAVAGYRKTRKQREEELKHDAVRDAAMGFFEKLGKQLEGKGRVIIYGLVGLVAVGALVGFLYNRSNKKAQQAQLELGKAIEITQAQVSASPVPGSIEPTYLNEKDRAYKAIEAFDKIINNYGDPYRENARYLKANQLLILDRAKGIAELEALTKSGDQQVAALSKLALAQVKETDGQLDAAAALYGELEKQNNAIVPAETARLYLAGVYEKQGKKQEAADILFNIVEAARKAKDAEGKPANQSNAAREAASKLQKLDPARYDKLTPEPTPDLNG
jgi:hypothetical protein